VTAQATTWTPRRLFHGVLATYLNVFVGSLLGFVVTPFLLNHLGDNRYGTWSMVLATMTYIGFLEGGVGTAATTRASAVNAIEGPAAVGLVMGTVRALMIVTATGTVLLAAVVGWFLPARLEDTGVSDVELRWTLLLAAVWMSLTFLAQVWNALYAGTGRMATTLRLGLVFNVLVTLAQVWAVWAGAGIIALAAALAIGNVLQVLILSYMARRHFPDVRISVRRSSRRQAGTLLRLGLRNIGVSLYWTLTYGLDIVIVGLVVGPAGAAAYAVAGKAASIVRLVALRFSDALVPAYGDAWHSKRPERLEKLFRLAVLLGMVLAIPISLAAASVAGPLLRVWLPSGPPAGSAAILILLVLLVALQIPGQFAVTLLTAIEQTHVAMRLLLTAAFLNAILSIVLTYLVGVTGPVWATLAVTLVFDPILFVVVIKKRLGLSIRMLLMPVVRYIWPATVVAAAVALAAWSAPVGDLTKCAIAALGPVLFLGLLLRNRGTDDLPRLQDLLTTVRGGGSAADVAPVTT
jgi:O-antigen/teichoic acid export membrane protein